MSCLLTTLCLVWLRPSKQIRAPLYSIKQKRQRRWIVIKYGFVFVLAVALFAAMLVIRKSICPFYALRYVLTTRSPALIFRQSLHVNCTICQSI